MTVAPEPIKYVVGFLFDDTGSRVILMEKNRPAWQVGLFNGPGGKVEPGESAFEAMHREFKEEAGVDVWEWEHFATVMGPDTTALAGPGWHCAFFCAKDTAALQAAHTAEDQEIVEFYPHDLPGTIPNVPWLINMALYSNREDWPYLVIEREGGKAL